MTTVHVRGPNSGSPCGRVDSITAFDSGPAQIAELRVSGDLGGNLSGGDDAIQGFDNVGVVRVTGDVLDTINANNYITDCQVLGDVYGDFVALGDGITTLVIGSQQVPGNLYGDVSAPNGDIKRLEVIDGDIGTAQSPATIAAGQGSSDRIEYINVPAGTVHANISAYNVLKSTGGDEGIHVTGNVANTTIELVNSFRDDFIITGGNFAGSSESHALHLADGAELKIKKTGGVGGSMLGDMYFSGVLGAQSLIEIDRSIAGILSFDGDGADSLKDDIYILGDLSNGQGLTGQIILNANATPNEAWGAGLVKFGPDGDPNQFSLSPVPYYNNKSADIGGGAVGLVPYNCHLKDCDPVASQPYLDACDQGYNAIKKVAQGGQVSAVTVRHYGRVLRAGTGKPFTVKRKQIGVDPCDGGDNWTDVTDSGPFTITMHPSGDDRAYRIDGPFAPAYDYMIQPKRTVGQGLDYLYCDDLDFNEANRVALEDYGYRLRVVVVQDLTMNGALETADIDAWIDEPVDTTLDGLVNNEDLADVIDAVANGG
jgi:hypothetical protein